MGPEDDDFESGDDQESLDDILGDIDPDNHPEENTTDYDY